VPEWSVLVEAGTGPGARLAQRLETALAEAWEAGLVTDALVAQNEAQRTAFWRVREAIPEANRKIGAVASHDVSVPPGRIADFVERGRAAVAAVDPGLRINAFGHLGDGNLHYNVFPAPGRRRGDYDHLRDAVQEAVHDLVHALGGSISAEHGIGRLKTADLARYGDPAKLAAMRAIKAALDPLGILNPGAVLGP
jgi:FAD/FMN-containing dehydrogenase